MRTPRLRVEGVDDEERRRTVSYVDVGSETRLSDRRSSMWTSVVEGRVERVVERRVGFDDAEGGQRRRVLGPVEVVGPVEVASGEKSGVLSRTTAGGAMAGVTRSFGTRASSTGCGDR